MNILRSVLNKKIKKKINRKKLIENIINVKKEISIPYPMKNKYNMIVPPNIFQTWHSKILPPLMYNATEKIRKINPKFIYSLYDDDDCREFILKNFDNNVLNAYDKLIPGAYKADLWRYCILYKYGGIYLDIKYIPVNNFKFINLTEKEHWVLDVDGNNIYNALIAAKSGNEILLKAINKIVENVNNNYYGNNALDITGPGMLSNLFSREEKNEMIMRHEVLYNNKIIKLNNYVVLRSYDGYTNECGKYQKKEHYSILWLQKKVY